MMLFQAHSGFRYLVLLLAVLVILYALWGVVGKRPYDKTMRILSFLFILSLDLTALLGISYLFVGAGDFYPQLTGHIATMVLALAVGHVVSAVMKRRPPQERTYMPHVVGTVIVVGLVAAGILAIGRPIVG